MATVQYYQALRISEACAIHWDDIHFDFKDPSSPKIVIHRAVKWKKDTGLQTNIGCLKNASAIGHKKEQPLFPESFHVLQELKAGFHRIGLVFNNDGKLFEYRTIQAAYNTAFKRAGLPYTSTHFMGSTSITGAVRTFVILG